jgi:hypothetical protein
MRVRDGSLPAIDDDTRSLPAIHDDTHVDGFRTGPRQRDAKGPLRSVVGVRVNDFPAVLAQHRHATAIVAFDARRRAFARTCAYP